MAWIKSKCGKYELEFAKLQPQDLPEGWEADPKNLPPNTREVQQDEKPEQKPEVKEKPKAEEKPVEEKKEEEAPKKRRGRKKKSAWSPKEDDKAE